jgi:hypothetical protein
VVNRGRLEPDVLEAEGKFRQTYRPIPQIGRQRIRSRGSRTRTLRKRFGEDGTLRAIRELPEEVAAAISFAQCRQTQGRR